MTTEQAWLQAWLVAAGAVALIALALALLARRRARRAEAALVALEARISVLESPAVAAPRALVDDATDHAAGTTYVITGVGADPLPADDAPVAQPIDGRLFADIVARETVVKAAAWTHGLRRALSPETRNRIRFQVRQETKRAGRDRRAEMKQALREFRARERDGVRTVSEDVA